MNAIKLKNGNMLIPRRADGPGGLIGHGMVEVTPDSPEYKEWEPWAVEDQDSRQ